MIFVSELKKIVDFRIARIHILEFHVFYVNVGPVLNVAGILQPWSCDTCTATPPQHVRACCCGGVAVGVADPGLLLRSCALSKPVHKGTTHVRPRTRLLLMVLVPEWMRTAVVITVLVQLIAKRRLW